VRAAPLKKRREAAEVYPVLTRPGVDDREHVDSARRRLRRPTFRTAGQPITAPHSSHDKAAVRTLHAGGGETADIAVERHGLLLADRVREPIKVIAPQQARLDTVPVKGSRSCGLELPK
jgi:hypothetical protein